MHKIDPLHSTRVGELITAVRVNRKAMEMTKEEFKQNILDTAEEHPIPIGNILLAVGIFDAEAQECIDELVTEGRIVIVDSNVEFVRRDFGGAK